MQAWANWVLQLTPESQSQDGPATSRKNPSLVLVLVLVPPEENTTAVAAGGW